MAKKAKEESAKKTNKKLKRTIMGSLSGVFMASALIVAAIPVKESQAVGTSDPIGTWTDAYDAKPDTIIPDYSSAPTYFDKDGLYGIASVMRLNSAETAGVLVFYDNGSSFAATHLVIPDKVECFTYNSDYKLQAVNKQEKYLYYVSKEAVYEDVSGNSVQVSEAEFSPCYGGSEYNNWAGSDVYFIKEGKDGKSEKDYELTEQLAVNVRYIGSKGYDVGTDYKLKPSGHGVFQGATKFSSAEIPAHILAIGDDAFKECTNLASVSFSNQIQVIGNHAFEDCRRLSTLTFDNSSTELKQIGAYTFANCVYLTSVDIPDSVQQIGSGCFMNCTALAAANLYGSNQDGNADLRNIGDGVFYNCIALGQLALPNILDADNITKMQYLLYNCTSLKYLTLPKNGGDFTYSNVTGCSALLRVTVLNRNTKFECTFGSTTSSKNGYKHADPSNSNMILHGNSLDVNDTPCTFCADNLGSFSPFNDYEVNDKFAIIAYRNSPAYVYACEHEYSIGYLDEGYEGQFERVKNNYFFTVDDKGQLTKFGLYKESGEATIVEIPENVGNFSITAIDSNTFSTFVKNGQIKYVYIPKSVQTIGARAFEGCTNLQAVEFENAMNVTEIGDAAFKTLTDKDIPLRFIGTISEASEPFKYAMKPENNYNSSSATTKYISYTSDFPNNLQVELVVEKDPVTQLVTKAVPTLISAPSMEQFKNSMGSNHYSLLHDIYDGVSGNSINRAYEEDKLVNSAYNKYIGGGDLTEDEAEVLNAVLRATVPAGIKGMKDDVYKGRAYLVSAVLNTITEVPDEAFKDCTKLETFIMRSSGDPAGESIGSHVFDGDKQLTAVLLPHTLKKMGDLPFYECSELTEVSFGDNPSFSCDNAIIYQTDAENNREIIECLIQRGNKVGAGKILEEEFTNVTSIRPGAFRDCPNISQVFFGDADIKEIPDHCFTNCERLNYCEVSGSTESIGEFAYLNTALSDIKIPPSVVLIPETAFTKGTEDNYEYIKGLSIQCEEPSAAYTYARKYGFSTEKQKPKIWKVTFFDYYGEQIGNVQDVLNGGDAIPPKVPSDDVPQEVEGLQFKGWKGDYTNVTRDMDIYADYGLPTEEDVFYDVTFYLYPKDYPGENVKICTRLVKKGEAASAPPLEQSFLELDGYTPLYFWLPQFDNVISDLDIYPQYKKLGGGQQDNTDNTDDPNKPNGNPEDKDKPGSPNNNPSNPGDTSTQNPTNNNGGTQNPASNNGNPSTSQGGGNKTSAGASRPASGSGGSTTAQNSGNKHNGTDVVVTKPGITNGNLISAIVNGSTDDFVLKISDSDSAKAAVEQALLNEYGSLDDIRYFAMDISLYDKTGTSKIQNLDGVSVTITMPIPDALTSYGGNNKVGSVINGNTLEKLEAKFTTINGVPCVSFVARHFSPYVIYVDLNNLSASLNGSDITPTTGDPIHPKWFLSIGLALISVVLFCLKGSSKKVVKVIA